MASDLSEERHRNRLVLFLRMAHRDYLNEGTPPPTWEALIRRASEFGVIRFSPNNFDEVGEQRLRDVLEDA